MCTLITLYGGITMAHAAIKNRATLIACRLLLGAFEAGFYPSAMFYISVGAQKSFAFTQSADG